MTRRVYVILIFTLVLVAFVSGALWGRRNSDSDPLPERRILYYVDPMNPSHTSERPGLAPCGMKLEPVYADDAGMAAGKEMNLLPGTVKITLEKQQLIGVRVGPVEKQPLQHPLRLLGKVAVDETRIYRLNATVDGWVTKMLPVTTGTHVKRDQTLASFYSPEFLSAGQALLFALNSKDRANSASAETPTATNRVNQFNINIQQYKDSLHNLGMGELQIQEMIQTRKFMPNINIVSPSDGFIAVRNLSEGQRFEKGTELFRIVDLSQVWIVADLFERDSELLPVNCQARVSVPGQGGFFAATLSESLPQFDNATRTLKLRFEAENPDFRLKPDMFVDVEFSVTLPETLVVPADAVLDSGRRKTVYVDRGKGFFEPRAVQTGHRVGDQVQILQGLMADERIVISGNFLLDSESRMKLAASGVHGAPALDPVCGMTVDEPKARAAHRTSEHLGTTYYFCNDGCKQAFDGSPTQYLGVAKSPRAPVAAAPSARSVDLVCGMSVPEAKARKAKRLSEFQGKTYFFCNDTCKAEFDANPARYVGAANSPPARVTDPVCGMVVDGSKAQAAGRVTSYSGKTYYFCNDGCKEEFAADPAKYLKAAAPSTNGIVPHSMAPAATNMALHRD